jgi:hypothetical protein
MAEAAVVETKQTETPPPVTTTTTEPVKTTTAPPVTEVEADDEPDEEILSVPKEHLDRIKSDPELKKIYRGLTKAAAQHRTTFEQEKAQFASERQIIELIREDPYEAAKSLAKFAGKEILEAPKPAVAADEITDKLAKVVGPDIAKAFKPILEEAIDERVKNIVSPLRAQTEQISAENTQARSEAEVAAFKSKHPGEITKEVEQKMLTLSTKIQASEEASPDEYLEFLYTLATAGKTKGQVTTEVVQRMAAAAASQEPNKTVTPGRVESQLDFTSEAMRKKSLDEKLDMAFAHARDRARSV